jgi:glycosyltransferase involved in cell wall biosynthesis
MSSVASGPRTLSVSVCICTRNRPAELRRALDSVAASSLRPSQVIVSDDGDEAATAALVAAHPLPIAYTEGPHSGLGANRNHAIAVATGDYLLFLDDDGTLGETFLEQVERALVELDPKHRARAIVTGADIEDGRVVVPNDQGLLGFQSRAYRPGEPLHTVVINAALFPRRVFERLRFDTNLKYGFDEVDITTQAVSQGYEIVPCFEALNYHFPSTIGRGDYRQLASASRLYVTFKRRRWTEGSIVRGYLGFLLAAGHLYAASVKSSGVAGIAEASRTVAQARSYHAAFLASTANANGPAR